MPDHGLTAQQLEIIRALLRPYARRIERVGLFGSRATGLMRPNSDIDMVLYGDVDQALVDHLWTLFDGSALPMTVDLNAYHLISHAPLKKHIDSVVTTLFERDDL